MHTGKLLEKGLVLRDVMETLLYLVPAVGILTLLFAAYLAAKLAERMPGMTK